MAESDYIVLLRTLVKSNPPGPGRPLGRLRVTLASTIKELSRTYNVSPAEVRRSISLSQGGGPFKLDKADRAFLTPKQMKAVGGYRRAGSKARVKFLLPPKRHIYDVLYFDVKQPPLVPGEVEQPVEATNYSVADGIDTGGSGKGVTFRITMRARGDPTKDMERMNDRLRNRFRDWLEGFDPSWTPSAGIVAQATVESGGPKGKRWMVQVVRQKRDQEKFTQSAGGPVIYHSGLQTRYKVAHNDLTKIYRKGDKPPVALGEVFTEN